MQTTSGDSHTTLLRARDHASRGDWVSLREMYDGVDHETTSSPELTLLFAEAQLRVGDARVAGSLLAELIPIVERQGDMAGHRRALNMLGAAHFEAGDLSKAEEAFSQALDRALADGDDLLVARSTNNLGSIANIRKRHEAALGLYQLAIPAFQRTGNKAGLAEAHHNMSIAYRDLRQLEQAERLERRAIEFAREAENPRLLTMARVGRAELNLLNGEAEVAHAGASIAAAECRDIPDPIGEADALRLVAAARLVLGALHEALPVADQAVQLARRHGNALVEAESLEVRARVFAQGGDWIHARADARQAALLYRRLDAQVEQEALERWMKEELNQDPDERSLDSIRAHDT